MPAGTRVHRCVQKVKASGSKVNPYAVCQKATKQSYATGKALQESQHSAGCACPQCSRAKKLRYVAPEVKPDSIKAQDIGDVHVSRPMKNMSTGTRQMCDTSRLKALKFREHRSGGT